MVRVVVGDDLDDRILRGAVGVGDDRGPLALVVDVDGSAEPVDEDGPTGAGRGDRDLQQLRRRGAQLVAVWRVTIRSGTGVGSVSPGPKRW